MPINWDAVVSQLTTATVVVAVIGWLAKSIATQVFKRDLEQHKATLKADAEERLAEFKRQADDQLQAQQHAFDLALETAKVDLESNAARGERVRQAIELWANPIRGAVRDLKYRLKNILEDGGYLALDKKAATKPPANWSITYAYFMPTTIYLCAQYFCWRRLLEEELTFELFAKSERHEEFLAALLRVGHALSTWPLPRGSPSGPDRQVFRLQQRIIGEALMATSDADPKCMRAETFLRRWETEPNFRKPFEPLAELLETVAPNSPRWARLETMYVALGDLEADCDKILAPPAGGAAPC